MRSSENVVFDDVLLQTFMDRFYGFGDYTAPYWFVGMEEGGGDDLTWAEGLVPWREKGFPELESMADTRPNIQRTWGGLIRILLAAKGETPTPAAILHYQQTQLARKGGESCLLELMPLPSPSVGHWLYASHSQLAFLRSRAAYMAHVAPHRIEHLRQQITDHQPYAVVFYSKKYRKYWQQVVGMKFQPLPANGIEIAERGPTLFVISTHPVGRGVTNDYLNNIGRIIRAHSAGQVGQQEVDGADA